MTPVAQAAGQKPFAVPDDPRLPQLGMALDVGRMMHLLPFPDSAGERDIRVSYIRYKPGTNCIVLYELSQENGPPQWAYAKLFADEPGLGGSDLSRVTIYSPRRRMAVFRFPVDLQLPALRMATGPEKAAQLLARLIPAAKRNQFAERWGAWTPVRYKPERRCVMRGVYHNPRKDAMKGFYARFYRYGEGVRTPEWHHHLSRVADSKVQVPRCLGYCEKRRVLLVTEKRGKALRRFFSEPETCFAEAVDTTAAALAMWHRLPPPPGAPLRFSESEQVKAQLARSIPY